MIRTIEDFENAYPTIGDLYDFAYDHSYYNDWYFQDRDSAMESIEEWAIDTIRDIGLEDSIGALNNIDFTYDYYLRADMTDWDWCDASDYYGEIAEWLFDCAIDDGLEGFGEEEEEEDEDTEPEIEPPIEDEDISFSDMFEYSRVGFKETVISKVEETTEEDDMIALSFLGIC